MNRIRSLGIIAIATTLSAGTSSAQTARDTVFLDSLLRAHRYPIALADGRLTGPGADFLDSVEVGTQFFMLGESHYVGEIPQFAAAWFERLRPAGVRHFAIEYGPVIGDMLTTAAGAGEAQTIGLGRRYPHAFHFWNDEELEAIARMRAPVWGLDNEWGALHALDRLAAIAPTPEARRAATALADSVRAVEGARPFEIAQVERYISGADSMALVRLRALFSPNPGSEAARLLDALAFSNRTYLTWGNDLTRYDANLGREQYMKDQFMARYRAAQAAGERLPRVLLKFGSEHGGKWISRSNVHALGNFLHEFAHANRMRSFHLVAWLVNEPGTYWSLAEEPPYALLGRAGDPKGWYVIDFRPLRPLVNAGRVRALSPELRRAIFGYDAVLLIGNGTRGTWEALRGGP